MLFDPRPKKRRDELYDRNEELQLLDKTAEKGEPLIAILGIRRIGKTSLLLSFLEKWDGLYLDFRGITRTSELYSRLAESIEERMPRISRLLKHIRGISLSGLEVSIKWRGQDSISLAGFLEEINKRTDRFILVLDEVQTLRPPLLTQLKNTIAYAYDHLENITIILSGSEIGLLQDFIGYDNPASPLYGRHILEIQLRRFTREESRDFLRKGFQEAGVRPTPQIVERGVELFDGIPGWLVYYGRSILLEPTRSPDEILSQAEKLALQELGKLTIRQKLVLKAIAKGADSWSKVRRTIEQQTGETIPKSALTRTIRRLEKIGIIQDYRFLDPIYEKASQKLKT